MTRPEQERTGLAVVNERVPPPGAAPRAVSEAQARRGELRAAANLRFGVLAGAAPLTGWQRSVIAKLAQTSGVQQDEGWLPSQGAAAVRDGGLDFILSFAPAAAGREHLRAARWGVWQFAFGDWSRYGGRSDGFWEIVDDSEVATAMLVQLQADADAVRVLAEGTIGSHPFLPSATASRLREVAAHWPRQVCLKLLDGADGCLTTGLVLASAAAARRRGAAACLAFAARAALRCTRYQLQQLLQHDQWNIGIIDAPIGSLLEPRLEGVPRLEPRWLKTPGRREFYADPFAIVHDGRRMIFCEHVDYRTGRGHIVAFDVDAPERTEGIDIGPPVHRSYPYLLEQDGRLFCIPETCEANEVALYEVERFPDRWRRVATLVSGLPLVDVTPFRYHDRWWLTASMPASRGANCELHVYYADALAGPWHPHPGNPVKIDLRSARPGGTPFWKDGALYRPAQDCTGCYGRRVVINRVVTLTECAFEEEYAAAVEPPRSGPYTGGLHTVSAFGDLTIVDVKRHIFVPRQGVRVLALGLRKLAGRYLAR